MNTTKLLELLHLLVAYLHPTLICDSGEIYLVNVITACSGAAYANEVWPLPAACECGAEEQTADHVVL